MTEENLGILEDNLPADFLVIGGDITGIWRDIEKEMEIAKKYTDDVIFLKKFKKIALKYPKQIKSIIELNKKEIDESLEKIDIVD